MNIVMGAERMTSASSERRNAQYKRYIIKKDMLGKWEGFTEDDLKTMSRANESKLMNAARNQRRAVTQKPKEGNERISANSNVQVQLEVRDASCLSDIKTAGTSENMDVKSPEITNPEPKEENPSVSTVCLKIKDDVAYEVLRDEFESKNESLSDFNLRQKMMEEQNRKKKELLAQALAERKKRTHAEAHRLQKIHEELQRLDNLLSSDVSILRDQIEAASLEYTVAQKRFDRAEKEYLDAKLILMSKLERKELLTAHLCTIIEQNEMRKAQKLSELMEKLQLSASDV